MIRNMKNTIKEKALKLGFTKSEVAALIKDIFSTQIEDKVKKCLSDSLTTGKFTATMFVLEQKWKNIREKEKQFDQYFKDNKLFQIKRCMSAEVRVMIGFGFPTKSYLQNGNESMNSVLKPADSTKCKSISEVEEKLRTGMKKQDN